METAVIVAFSRYLLLGLPVYIVTSVIQEQLQEPLLLAIVGYVNKSPNIE
jgi:hypothetical protein